MRSLLLRQDNFAVLLFCIFNNKFLQTRPRKEVYQTIDYVKGKVMISIGAIFVLGKRAVDFIRCKDGSVIIT